MSETSEAVHEKRRNGGRWEKQPILIKRGECQLESKSGPAQTRVIGYEMPFSE